MYLIEPEVLADLSGLSIGLCVIGILLGLALWLLGWRRHRFWVVLGITFLGGVLGLSEAQALHAQPVVAGVLLALGAGVLALALARLLAFGAAGLVALLAVKALVPTWDQHLVSFLTGGLLGVLLFRLWVMVLTSLGGTLLLGYSSLCLVERLAKLNAAEFADRHAVLLNWSCGGLALLGMVFQLLLNRGRRDGKSAGKDSEEKPGKADKPPAAPRWGWWPPFRKAG
ncbi:MAG: hypothetical protein L0Z62_23355 [Gemmataceae bacterium]|nr:hypothetical protein [Gemmataceae bacterium]